MNPRATIKTIPNIRDKLYHQPQCKKIRLWFPEPDLQKNTFGKRLLALCAKI